MLRRSAPIQSCCSLGVGLWHFDSAYFATCWPTLLLMSTFETCIADECMLFSTGEFSMETKAVLCLHFHSSFY